MSASVSASQAAPAAERASKNILYRFATHYLTRRIAKAVVTMWLVITLTFFLIHLMPGNPIDAFVSQQMAQYGLDYTTARNMAAAIFSVDLHRPLPLQYL